MWMGVYFLGGAFGLDDFFVGVLIIEGCDAVVEEGVVVGGGAERVLLLFHLYYAVHAPVAIFIIQK